MKTITKELRQTLIDIQGYLLTQDRTGAMSNWIISLDELITLPIETPTP